MTKEKKGGLHGGHRERFRQRYKKNGIKSFEFHEIMEFLLFFSYPRTNVNEQAHRLGQAFGGSITKILDADITELTEKGGISETAALNLKIYLDIMKLYFAEKLLNGDGADPQATQPEFLERAVELVRIEFSGENLEKVLLLFYDNGGRLISREFIHEGSVNSVSVSANRIVRYVFAKNASAIIIAHNHPKGLAVPSPEDIMTTRSLRQTLSSLGINLIEHFVVSGAKVKGILGSY